MMESVTFWRRAAMTSCLLLVILAAWGIGYLVLWPSMQNGNQSAAYLDACIRAKICPTADQIAERLKASAAATPAPPSAPKAEPAPGPAAGPTKKP